MGIALLFQSSRLMERQNNISKISIQIIFKKVNIDRWFQKEKIAKKNNLLGKTNIVWVKA